SALITYSIQPSPVLIKGSYMLTQKGFIQPFATLGLGADLVHYRKFYGEFADEKSALGFAGQAGLGINIQFGITKSNVFHIAAEYNYLPYTYNDLNGMNYIGIRAGLSIALHH